MSKKKKTQKEELRESNGLRTAVKYWHMTANEAIDVLLAKSKQSGYLSSYCYKWLKRKIG